MTASSSNTRFRSTLAEEAQLLHSLPCSPTETAPTASPTPAQRRPCALQPRCPVPGAGYWVRTGAESSAKTSHT